MTGRDDPSGDPETRYLARELDARGWGVEIAMWSDPEVPWGDTPWTILRSTWDYPRFLVDFLRWTTSVDRVTTLLNPPELVRGNVDKRYLLTLADRGVPVVPTRWVAHPDHTSLALVRQETGWSDLVVKPSVGCDGIGVTRVGPTRAALQLAATESGWLVQPFVSSIVDEGEQSVVVIDGEPEYATLKRPPGGGREIRVQERWGGTTGPIPLSTTAADAARSAVVALGVATPPLYARVDLMQWASEWHVAEIELIEPSFYLLDDPRRVDPFERALRRRVQGR